MQVAVEGQRRVCMQRQDQGLEGVDGGLLDRVGVSVAAIEVHPQGVRTVVAVGDAVGVEHRHNLEDEMVACTRSAGVITEEELEQSVHDVGGWHLPWMDAGREAHCALCWKGPWPGLGWVLHGDALGALGLGGRADALVVGDGQQLHPAALQAVGQGLADKINVGPLGVPGGCVLGLPLGELLLQVSVGVGVRERKVYIFPIEAELVFKSEFHCLGARRGVVCDLARNAYKVGHGWHRLEDWGHALRVQLQLAVQVAEADGDGLPLGPATDPEVPPRGVGCLVRGPGAVRGWLALIKAPSYPPHGCKVTGVKAREEREIPIGEHRSEALGNLRLGSHIGRWDGGHAQHAGQCYGPIPDV
mmetsp:Transcript_114658/g.199411  ORF Transcript_114658/g.199411 Transcript_114658/m.199411 type:complete len:359 (+) Transcript_114658:977-2053(+)